jgi:hypothetical protein
VSMTDIDPLHRLDAKDAKDRLGTIVYSMAPESLLIKPDVVKHPAPIQLSTSGNAFFLDRKPPA